MLFRPPYSVDAEPDTEDEVRPLELTQSLGYVTSATSRHQRLERRAAFTPKEIALSLLRPPAALQPTSERCGNIVMHDGWPGQISAAVEPAVIQSAGAHASLRRFPRHRA